MADIYEAIKEKILDRFNKALKGEEDFKWVKGWKGDSRAKNFVTGNNYNGINIVLLDNTGSYLTFNQVKSLEGKVRKGAKAQMVIFYKKIEKKVKAIDGGEENKIYPMIKRSNVFHESDIEGIEFPIKEVLNKTINEKCTLADNIISSYKESVIDIVESNSDRAFYEVGGIIKVPKRELFKSNNEYYATVFHEMIHSTGLALKRDLEGLKGTKSYAFEELVAEIGANMLLSHTELIFDDGLNSSIGYLTHWNSVIKDTDSKTLVKAMSQSAKAADYILEKTLGIDLENAI